MDANQGNGPAIVMWPSNDVWPGPEIDLMEDWSDPTRKIGYATIHWAGADGSNQYQVYTCHANMTRQTNVAMDWEPGSLTLYVNYQRVFTDTGPNVPKDAADGGTNEAFGAEVASAGSNPVSSSVSLHLYDMKYSTYRGSTSGAASGTASPALVGSFTAPSLIGPNTGTPADLPAISPSQGDVTFTFESVQGQEVISNFQPSDTLDLASSLRSSMQEAQTPGGVLLTFGSPSNSILLIGVSHLDNSQIRFI
jgi:hypothetical protein